MPSASVLDAILASEADRAQQVGKIMLVVLAIAGGTLIVLAAWAAVCYGLDRACHFIGGHPSVAAAALSAGALLIAVGYIVAVPPLWIAGVVVAGSTLILMWWHAHA